MTTTSPNENDGTQAGWRPLNGYLDPFLTPRDHANQWDLSAIWHTPVEPETDLSELERFLREVSA